MKVALVCSSFFLDRSYQENIWAEQLVKLGHTVRVISTGPQTTIAEVFESPAGRYEVQRVRTRTLPRSVYISNETANVVRQFNPDLMVIYGDKRFTLTVARDKNLQRVPMISTYSENLSMHEYDWRKGGISAWQRVRALGFSLLRGGPIRVNCRRSDLIINNTPNSREIILRMVNDAKERTAISDKMIEVPLGFSPEHFGFDPELRQNVRRELGIADHEIVVCTTSKFEPEKADSIRLVIDSCRKVMSDTMEIKALIVGFSDSPTSRQIREHIANGKFAERFIQQPFADRNRLNRLFNAADIAVYNRITISCQEALGTGLVCCFADNGSFHHLVKRPQHAGFFKPFDANDLTMKIGDAVRTLKENAGSKSESHRRELAQASRWLGYDHIIPLILAALRKRHQYKPS